MSSNTPLEFVKTGFGLASQFMNACASSWGKLIEASHPFPQFSGLIPMLDDGEQSHGPLLAAGPFVPAWEYLIDASQRTILFLDVLRERGNQYLKQISKTAPHVLDYEFELIMDGRSLKRATAGGEREDFIDACEQQGPSPAAACSPRGDSRISGTYRGSAACARAINSLTAPCSSTSPISRLSSAGNW